MITNDMQFHRIYLFFYYYYGFCTLKEHVTSAIGIITKVLVALLEPNESRRSNGNESLTYSLLHLYILNAASRHVPRVVRRDVGRHSTLCTLVTVRPVCVLYDDRQQHGSATHLHVRDADPVRGLASQQVATCRPRRLPAGVSSQGNPSSRTPRPSPTTRTPRTGSSHPATSASSPPVPAVARGASP